MPSGDEWIDALGLEAEPVDGEDWVRQVRWSTGAEDVVSLTETAGLIGQLTIHLLPEIWLDDQLLFV